MTCKMWNEDNSWLINWKSVSQMTQTWIQFNTFTRSWMRVSHDNNLRWISWYIITVNQLIVKSNLVLWLLWVKKKNTNLNHCDYVKLGSFLTL